MKKDNFVIYLANSIIKFANGKNIKINSIKLNNLIYLIYTDYFYHTQHKLFNEQFSLSHKGPIIPSIYFKFNSYGEDEIKTYASDSKRKIYTVHNESLDSIINYNLDLHGYSYVDELIEITKKRMESFNNYFNGEIKNSVKGEKVYTLQLKPIEMQRSS